MIRALLCVAPGLILVTRASTASAASIVTEWLDEALPSADEVAWEPTVSSRFFAIFHTAIYDAWTAYDPVAVGVVSDYALKNQAAWTTKQTSAKPSVTRPIQFFARTRHRDASMHSPNE